MFIYISLILCLFISQYLYIVGHKGDVNCVKRLSATRMASAGDDGTIIIWDWLSGTRIHILESHTNILYVGSLDLFDENTLMSGSWDLTIRFWNISTGTLLETLPVMTRVNVLAMLRMESLKFLFKGSGVVIDILKSLKITNPLSH